jgi:hypothetical protein
MGRSSQGKVANTANPFGKAVFIEFRKEDGGKGLSVESMQAKTIEAGYIEPEQRSNPEYLKALADKQAAEKMKKTFGFAGSSRVIGASPNSPQSRVQTIF